MNSRGLHQPVARIWRWIVVMLVVLTLGLGVPTLGWAQWPAAKAAPALTKAAAQAAQKPAPAESNAKSGLHTGIKVHGHWVLEVKNPDGKVVSHTEFENSLVSGGSGDNLLTQILAGNVTLGAWAIFLSNGTGTGPCSTGGTSHLCSILSASATALGQQQACSTIVGSASPQPSCYATLTETIGGTAQNQLMLSGSAYVDTSTQISVLQSGIATCGALSNSSMSLSTVAPSACLPTVTVNSSGPANAGIFTSVGLPQSSSGLCGGANQPPCAVNVSAGQTVAVLVTFSFQ